ncbi:PREDICTED: inositol monophosphatase 2 [Calidris pugnax]|uniref:inositol monophosphatase 2 n=1 Tax=Calidris pugnax TaxID=198806 RepID=UPI00071D10AF|nr:PREDICTED: inositol monophosphatase 2 [Calidris pugnax]
MLAITGRHGHISLYTDTHPVLHLPLPSQQQPRYRPFNNIHPGRRDPAFCTTDQADRKGDLQVARRAAAPMNPAQQFRAGNEGDGHLQLSHTAKCATRHLEKHHRGRDSACAQPSLAVLSQSSLLYGIIRKALTEEKQVSTKTSAADLVTETDHFVENLIISVLKEKFPSHRFIAEESTAAGSKCVLTDSPTWIIDPVDGTCNFVHRFPTVAVSIGFAVNKELEFGVIYHCTEERLYTGRRGQGAFCNDKRLQVSKETDISKALILTEIGPKRDPATLKLFLGNIERLLKAQAHGVRVIGSSTLALCHLASGAADAYYQFGLHCWDLAAATVIIREAGGTVIDTSGGPLDLMSCRVIAAGTREMAMFIAQEIQTIHYRRDDEN